MKVRNFKTTYFYCREHDSSLNTAVSVLKGILRQLLVHNQEPLPSCMAKKAHSGEEVLTNIDTIKSLLELFCDCDMNQFIVIDGLDECNFAEVKPIVKFWMSMVDKCDNYKPGKIRVLFVSQDSGDIRKLMQSSHSAQPGQSVDIFDLPLEQSEADIDRYITARFAELRVKFELTPNQTHGASALISKRAEGRSYPRMPGPIALLT